MDDEQGLKIGNVKIEAFGGVTTPVAASIQRIEHDIAFLGRALVRVLELVELGDTALQVQKLVDFYEAIDG